jgi:hypothetical protein
MYTPLLLVEHLTDSAFTVPRSGRVTGGRCQGPYSLAVPGYVYIWAGRLSVRGLVVLTTDQALHLFLGQKRERQKYSLGLEGSLHKELAVAAPSAMQGSTRVYKNISHVRDSTTDPNRPQP